MAREAINNSNTDLYVSIPYIEGNNMDYMNKDLTILYDILGEFKLVGSGAVMIYCNAYGDDNISKTCKKYELGDYDIVLRSHRNSAIINLVNNVKNGIIYIDNGEHEFHAKSNNIPISASSLKNNKAAVAGYDDKVINLRSYLAENLHKGVAATIKVEYIDARDNNKHKIRWIRVDLIIDGAKAVPKKIRNRRKFIYRLGSDTDIDKNIYLDDFMHLYNTYSKAIEEDDILGMSENKIQKKQKKHALKQQIVKHLYSRNLIPHTKSKPLSNSSAGNGTIKAKRSKSSAKLSKSSTNNKSGISRFTLSP